MSIKWGIISTGNIARAFAAALRDVDDAELLAVGSRSQESADAFGDEFDVPRRYDSYEKLVADSDVDVIYIGTPHNFHYENVKLCFDAGKHVLCEKPLTINASEAAELIAIAREKKLFFMEAIWTRFLPSVAKLREILASGTLGTLRQFHADFSVRMQYDAQSRLFNPALAGGALLDLGVYPVSFASMVFGKPPDDIVSLAHIGETGVDNQMSGIFRYDGGALATFACSFEAQGAQEAFITGTDGWIRIHKDFHHPERMTLFIVDREPEELHIPHEINPYAYEAIEAVRCIQAGLLESPLMPLDESLALMQTMDTMRAQWGLRYPQEQ